MKQFVRNSQWNRERLMATIATSEPKTDSKQSLETVPNWISGKAVAGQAKSFADVFNPATGEVKRRVPLDGTAELEQAVAAATAAFPEWSNMPPLRRARVLFRFRDLLLHFENLHPRLDERALEARDLIGDLSRFDPVTRDIVHFVADDMRSPARDAGRDSDALKTNFLFRALVAHLAGRVTQMSTRENVRSQLMTNSVVGIVPIECPLLSSPLGRLTG